MTPEHAVIAAITICLVGAVLMLGVGRNKTTAGVCAFVVTAFTAGLVLWAVAKVLTYGPSPHGESFWEMAALGSTPRIHVDGLSAVFLALAAVISVPAALYSIAYMRHYADYDIRGYYPYCLVFLAAMYGLVTTTDMMWFFLTFWLMMTVPGYFLIRYEGRKRENVRAAGKYLIMMLIACLATMVGAEILVVKGSQAIGSPEHRYDFDHVSASLPALLASYPGMAALAFGLFLVGFGIKMGMWPFGQVWLPDAHPAAPSPVSALLSGVMIKTGVYGLLRYFLWLVPAEATDYPLAAWGLVIALLGTVTLFTGTMQALQQTQTKRLLAFHSIGQVGYILLGSGVCMALLQEPDDAMLAVAALGFYGALLHVMNHGLFKALLFLNAGSLLSATGTQDLNRMGGLARYMPLTAVTALVASFSISGVPMLNGFVSKWCIYVSSIQGSGAARYLAVCAVVAILTSALTLASFAKFLGASFLCRTSALVADRAKQEGRLEVCATMQLPQVVLALFCVALGVVPAIGMRFVQLALEASRQGFGGLLADANPVAAGATSGVDALSGAAVFVPLTLGGLVGCMLLVAIAISKVGRAPRRADAPWLCGYARESEQNRYSAHNLYGEVTRYFRWLGGAPRSHSGKHSGPTEP